MAKSTKELNDLRGPVKTARVETFEFKEEDGQRVEKFWYAQSWAFDPAGNVTEVVHHNADGSSFRTSHFYDHAGLLTEVAQHDASGAVVSRTFHDYDEGRKVRERIVAADGAQSVNKIYTYADDGSFTEEQIFDESVSEAGTSVAFGIEGAEGTSHIVNGARSIKVLRDAASRPREALFYGAGDVLLNRLVYTYDDRGNLIEETQHVGDVSPFGACAADARPANDPDGESSPRAPTEEELAEIAKMFAPGAPLIRQVYKYDEQGRRIEAAMMFQGEVADKRAFVYDEEGRKIEEVYYDENGALQSKAIFDREYDAYGNWIKETVSSASSWDAEFGLSTPSTINRRTITYY